MKPCTYLGLGSNKPETQLVWIWCEAPARSNTREISFSSPSAWSIPLLSSLLPPQALHRHLCMMDNCDHSVSCPESSQSWDLSQGSPLIQPSQERRISLENGHKDMGNHGENKHSN